MIHRGWITHLLLLSMISMAGPHGVPAQAEADEDVCAGRGMVVRNLTTVDLWYLREGGECFKWKQNKLFVIKPDEHLEIFSDMVCEKRYCKRYLTYESYRAVDGDNDCRVRVLPGCSLSDM